MDCTLTRQDYIMYILRSLQVGDSCDDNLEDVIDFLWRISKIRGACDLELQYLYTRLEAIKFLMGCASQSVDQKDGYTNRDSRSKSDSKRDGISQSHETNQTNKFSDQIAQARYDDLARAGSDSLSQRNADTVGFYDGFSNYRDTGAGSGSMSYGKTDSSGSARVEHEDSTSSSQASGSFNRNGCHFSRSKYITNGQGVNSVFVFTSKSARNTQYQAYSRDFATGSDTSTGSGAGNRALAGNSFHEAQYSRTHSSFFQANVISHEEGAGRSDTLDNSATQKDAKATASGFGSSSANIKAQGNSSSQGTSESHEKYRSDSESISTGQGQQLAVFNHQKFENLRDLYDNTLVLIKLKRERLKALKPAWGQMLLTYLDGCCPIAELLATGELRNDRFTNYKYKPIGC